MLTGYCSTPHPATGIASYEALMNRQVRTKLDLQTRESSENVLETAINERDERYKQKLKQNAENMNTKAHDFIVGDHVLLKQNKRNKWSTAYEPALYTVIRTNGSSIAARRITDGREVHRDTREVKVANALIRDNASEERDDWKREPASEDWREKILLNASAVIDKTEQNRPLEFLAAVTRPRRGWRRPDYLKDYVT